MHHRIAALLSFLVFFLLASLTYAGSAVHDPSLGLTMDIGQPGAVVCIVLPPGQEDQGCEGVDVPTVRAALLAEKKPAQHFALVRFEEWGFGVTVNEIQASPFTQEQIGELIAEMEKGTAGPMRGSRQGRSYDVIELRDVQGIRMQWVVPAPEGTPNQAISYVLMQQRRSAMVTFIFHEKDAARMDPIATSTIATLTMPVHKNESFGQSKYYLIGYYGAALGLPVLGITIGLVVALVQITRKRRREALAQRSMS